MTDYEQLLEEVERSVVMPPPREPGRCDDDVSCPECDRDGYARCGLEHDHDGDHVPFADVYERGLRNVIGKLAAALREVMAERDAEKRRADGAEAALSLQTERVIRAERRADLRLQLEMAALEQVCSDLDSAQTVRRLVADVEAMRAVCDAARLIEEGSCHCDGWCLYHSNWSRKLDDALRALDARDTPNAKETKP